MAWTKENTVTFFQNFCMNVLKIGRVPRHVAFIMDGNRRSAKKIAVNTSSKICHSRGFSKLTEVLQWCLHLGISEVTVYAFSIENFKRPEEEVNAVMELACDKFQDLLNEINSINEMGLNIRVIGRLSLLPDVLKAFATKCMRISKQNSKLKLNMALAYTGRDEISRAASYIVDSVKNKELNADDIDEVLVSSTLELGEPELLVRTSGEVRLSDFMLWQISNTVLYYSDVLWPEFTIWNLFAAIIHFQRYAPSLREKVPISNKSKQIFLDKLTSRRIQVFENGTYR